MRREDARGPNAASPLPVRLGRPFLGPPPHPHRPGVPGLARPVWETAPRCGAPDRPLGALLHVLRLRTHAPLPQSALDPQGLRLSPPLPQSTAAGRPRLRAPETAGPRPPSGTGGTARARREETPTGKAWPSSTGPLSDRKWPFQCALSFPTAKRTPVSRLPPALQAAAAAAVAASVYLRRGGRGARAAPAAHRRLKKSLGPRSRVQAPGPGRLASSRRRAARSSGQRRLLHSCSSCTSAAIRSQRPRRRGPCTAQPAEGGGSGPQRLEPSGAPTPVPVRCAGAALGKRRTSRGPRGLQRGAWPKPQEGVCGPPSEPAGGRTDTGQNTLQSRPCHSVGQCLGLHPQDGHKRGACGSQEDTERSRSELQGARGGDGDRRRCVGSSPSAVCRSPTCLPSRVGGEEQEEPRGSLCAHPLPVLVLLGGKAWYSPAPGPSWMCQATGWPVHRISVSWGPPQDRFGRVLCLGVARWEQAKTPQAGR